MNSLIWFSLHLYKVDDVISQFLEDKTDARKGFTESECQSRVWTQANPAAESHVLNSPLECARSSSVSQTRKVSPRKEAPAVLTFGCAHPTHCCFFAYGCLGGRLEFLPVHMDQTDSSLETETK